jgi:hypothetical protein
MGVVVGLQIVRERAVVAASYSTRGATVPRVLPTAGKREGISF